MHFGKEGKYDRRVKLWPSSCRPGISGTAVKMVRIDIAALMNHVVWLL